MAGGWSHSAVRLDIADVPFPGGLEVPGAMPEPPVRLRLNRSGTSGAENLGSWLRTIVARVSY